MAFTSRKKRPLERTGLAQRDCRLIIIATEGRKTEKQYFDCLLQNSPFLNTRVQLKVLPTGEDNISNPSAVLERLKKFKEEYELKDKDELWLMVDVDRWGEQKLADIAKQSQQNQFDLVISNPCFEIWLLCHFQLPNISSLDNCSSVEKQLREQLGSYQKSNLNCDLFNLQSVQQAIQFAKSLDTHPLGRWTTTAGTRVYRVVESILTALKTS